MALLGFWSALTNTPTLTNGVGTAYDCYTISESGTQNLGAGAIQFTKGYTIVYLPDGLWHQEQAQYTIELVPQTGGGGGMTNPMTTLGDMIYGFTAGAPVRLPIGTASQVLQVVAGIPSWQTLAASLVSISGTTNRILITSGSTTTPVIDISPSYIGQPSISTVGTITNGRWHGVVVEEQYGGTGQSGYATGDILYASNTNILSRLPGNTSSAMLFLSQTGDGTSSSAPSWQPIPVLGTLVYYWTPTASDISGDKKQIASPYPTTFPLSSSGVTNGQLLYSFATDPGAPSRTFIPDGQYSVHMHLAQTAGTKTSQVYAEVWEISSGGTDIALITLMGNSTVLTGVSAEYFIATSRTNYTLASTSSRILTRIYATITGGGSAPTIAIYVGNGTDSRTNLPSTIVDATNFVPYTGATSNLDLNAKTISNANWNGTAIPILYGGTGQTTANAAYNALSPMTIAGDMEYESSGTTAARLPRGSARQVLTMNSSLLPAWADSSGITVLPSVASTNGFAGSVAGDATITLRATPVGILKSNGTVMSAATPGTDYSTYVDPMTTRGDMVYETSGTTAGRLPIGLVNQVLTVGSNNLPIWQTSSGTTYTASKGITIVGNDIELASIAATSVLANTTGGSAAPSLPLAYASASTASALALRDSNQNTFANAFINGSTSVTSAGGTTTLTVASTRLQVLTGSSTQTFKLPDATTLTAGDAFIFNNNSTGVLTIVNNGSTVLATVNPLCMAYIWPLTVATTNGTWDIHYFMPTTTAGDLAYETSGTTVGRLPIGTVNQVLTVNSNNLPAWTTSTALTNPMTTAGDLIYESSGTTATRLPASYAGYLLTMSSGLLPVWQAPAAPTSYTGLVEEIDFEDNNSSIAATTYTISPSSAYGYTINTLKVICTSGTCTAAIKINGVAVTGISAVSVSNVIATGTATALNTVAVGDVVTFVTSSNSSLIDIKAAIKITRT